MTRAMRASHEKAWLESAALRPETGKVLAIGVISDKQQEIFHGNEEAKILGDWWDFFQAGRERGKPFAGWGVYHFDLPFAILRSRILGIPVPLFLREGRNFNPPFFIDIQDAWLLGRPRNEVECSLDYVARALGIGRKTGQGRDFASLYAFGRGCGPHQLPAARSGACQGHCRETRIVQWLI
jgi:hypothetical protein